MTTWLRFLEETIADDGAIRDLQRFFGYCLLPEAKYRKALVLCGPGLGKSTITHVLTDMVGRERCTALDPWELRSPFGRYYLCDSLVNVADDLWEPEDLAALKPIIGGDIIWSEKKGHGPVMFTATTKLVFTTNSMPWNFLGRFRSWDSRLLTIRFVNVPDVLDADLCGRLLAERDAIRQWAIAGLQDLDARGKF